MEITDITVVAKNIFHIKAIGEINGEEVLFDIPRFHIDMDNIKYKKESTVVYGNGKGGEGITLCSDHHEEKLSLNVKTEVLKNNMGQLFFVKTFDN